MDIPTLGYEKDSEISKSKIAQIQLTEAINLLLDDKFLCAITLAGAAEEIFARSLNANKEMSAVENSFMYIQNIRELTGLPVMENRPKNEIFNRWNKSRNTLKHYSKKEGDVVSINLFDSAYWMIKRALKNASKLGVVISNEVDFENWCITKLHL